MNAVQGIDHIAVAVADLDEATRLWRDVLGLEEGARETIEDRCITGTIYSHPIGFHGHGAGGWLGAWDNQDGMPGGKGSFRLNPNTAWSIELNAEYEVPDWGGQKVRFMTEEDAYFDGETVRFLDGRQTEITLIPRQQ